MTEHRLTIAGDRARAEMERGARIVTEPGTTDQHEIAALYRWAGRLARDVDDWVSRRGSGR